MIFLFWISLCHITDPSCKYAYATDFLSRESITTLLELFLTISPRSEFGFSFFRLTANYILDILKQERIQGAIPALLSLPIRPDCILFSRFWPIAFATLLVRILPWFPLPSQFWSRFAPILEQGDDDPIAEWTLLALEGDTGSGALSSGALYYFPPVQW